MRFAKRFLYFFVVLGLFGCALAAEVYVFCLRKLRGTVIFVGS
jgi:hypothetical protein